MRHSAKWIGALLVAALAPTLWLLADDPVVADPVTPSGPSGPPPPVEDNETTEPPPTAQTDRFTQVAPTHGRLPGLPDPDAFEAPVETGLLVKVIDPTGTPVGGAIVRVWTEELDSRARAIALIREGARQFIQRCSRAYRSDDDGTVRVPSFTGEMFIHASSGDREAFVRRNKRSTSMTVELQISSDPTILVDVISAADGHPVSGVPIVFRTNEHLRGHPVVVTDSAGRATLRHFTWPLLDQTPRNRGKIAIAIPLATRVEHKIRLDRLPSEPVVLKLPPTGSVTVDVVTPEGVPIVNAAVMVHPKTEGMFTDIFGPAGAVVGRTDRRGRVHFPFVGPGTEPQVSVWTDTVPFVTREALVSDVVVGDDVHHTITFDPSHTRIVGRFVSADGAPLPYRAVDVDIKSHDDLAVSDEHGHFSFVLDPRAARQSPRLATFDAKRPRVDATVALPTPLPTGELDLGDVVLEPDPVVIAGRVIDEAGHPLVGAQVSARYGRPGERGSKNLPTVLSDAAGAFAVRGEIGDGTGLIRLQAWHRGFATTTVRDQIPGTHGLEIRLALPATFIARIVPPRGATRLRAILYFGDETRREKIDLKRAPDSVTVRFDDVPPTTARLRIVVPRGPTLTTVRNIVLRPGENSPDPRLDPLDLSTGRRFVDLRVVDEAGKEIGGTRGRITHPDGTQEAEVALVTIGLLGDSDVLEISAAGYIPVTIQRPALGQRVVMVRIPR